MPGPPRSQRPDDDARQSLATLKREYQWLHRWLLHDAYPLWAAQGYDQRRGGFEESLTSAGPVIDQPRRARVQARQIYAFARAASFGWQPEVARRLVTDGLQYFLARYRRPDGLFRTLVGADGQVLDERAWLYDQAFVLLALAESEKLLRASPELIDAAQSLRAALYRHLKPAGPGFFSGVTEPLPLLSNPHMHLLEAALSWTSVDTDQAWRGLADEIVALALDRFLDAASGALREQFDEHWAPSAGIAGRIVEPGHQFEWAWLLLQWGGTGGSGGGAPASYPAAVRLAQIGETHGMRGGVAVNALLDDFSVHDAEARLWPQTERLKAAALLGAMTQDPRYWSFAAQAAQGLRRYLGTEVPGLWYDRLQADGHFVQQSAPASSFYHIVCAIGVLGDALEHRAPTTE
jgi:mannose/cellobiose epimerase-like protein (N-acyl-D-glucosamine 2-epimerase family)